MADTKLTGLTENSDPQSTDIMYIVDDPGGSPLGQKITLLNLIEAILEMGSSGVSVVATDTDTGASPHSVDTTGYQSGDLAIWAMSSRNSAINDAGPEGGGWTKLWRVDTDSDEEGAAFYKVCGGAEGATWEWTHASGDLAVSGMILLRNLDNTIIQSAYNETQTSPLVLGSFNGIQILIYHACYQVTDVDVTDPGSLLTVDINIDNNDQGLIIAHRDCKLPVIQPQFVFTGGNTGYVVSGAVTFE